MTDLIKENRSNENHTNELTEERFARLEQLLQTQTEQNKKLLASSKIRTIFTVCLAAAIVIGIFAIYGLFANITKEFPQLVQSTTELVDMTQNDLSGILTNIGDIDFKALDEGVKGFASLDFASINSSIQALEATIRPFAEFIGLLSGGTPAGTP